MAEPLIFVFTLTCNRPNLLARTLKCFERQTYRNKFLLILDDLHQYDADQRGDQWELVSLPRRVSSLAEKNNVAIAMAPRDAVFIGKMDDDDWFAPWHLESLVEALGRGPLVQPRHVVDFWHGKWSIVETFNRRDRNRFCYHSAWGYSRELFERVGGYRPGLQAGDDGEFQERLLKLNVRSVDVDTSRYRPSYWYNRPLTDRISEAGDTDDAYWNMCSDATYVGQIPAWADESDWERPVPTEVIRRPW